MKKILLIILAIELVAVFVFYHIYYGTFSDNRTFLRASANGYGNTFAHAPADRYNDFSKENEIDASVNVTQNITEFKVNAPLNFDRKTKAEIYEIRKKFVEKSLFKNPEYKPSETVFGQIVDGEPWIPLKEIYYEKSEPRQSGLSEESRFINNPSALVMLDVPFSGVTYGRHWGEDMYLLPESVVYYKKENTIKVTYSLKRFFNEIHPGNKDKFLYFLDGLNARDFGYPWVFVYESGGVTFKHDNIKSAPEKFRKFIHLGMSTGIPRNNGSPSHKELDFRIDKLPSRIYMKLWREKPSSPAEKADINVDLTFL
ncbi:MAG: hypothetical protein FWD54_06145 [Endomicrobia bacterium]|nr:hypothetical protein [Endomicrobiia bacterium]